MDKMIKFLKNEDGAVALEYALLVGLIALAMTIGAGSLGRSLNTYFGAISKCIPDLPR
ncbi:MAG: Flp family type IVb pilin [bacterium]